MDIKLDIKYIINIISESKEFINIFNNNTVDDNTNINNIYEIIILISKVIKSNSFLKDKTLDNIINQNIEQNIDKLTLFQLYNDICIIKYCIKICINKIKLLNDKLHIFNKNIQSELLKKYKIILDLYKKRKDVNKSDTYLFIYNKMNILEFNNDNDIRYSYININELNELDNLVINNFTMYKLYKDIIYKLINKLLEQDIHDTHNDNINLLLSHVEKIKNLFLNKDLLYDNSITLDYFNLDKNKNNTKNKKPEYLKNNINNPFIKSFGLSPISKFNSLKDITDIIIKKIVKNNGKENKIDIVKKESDLIDLVKYLNSDKSKKNKSNISLIVINKLIKNPIEFDISKLYDKNEIKNYKQGETNGINIKYISKFTTIKFKEINNKWNFNTTNYGSLDNNNFIILEKINKDNYRILKKYSNINIRHRTYNIFENVLDSDGIINNRNVIFGFITFILNKNIIYDNDRINIYNNMIESKIVKNMILYNKVDNFELNKSSKIIDVTLLKYDLVNKIIQIINNLSKNKKIFKNKKDIINLMHNDMIINCFSNFLITHFLSYISEKFKNYNNSNYYINDLLKTFIAQLLIVKTNFQKKIHDIYIEKESELIQLDIKSVKSFLENIFIEVLDLLITVDDNIYLSVIYKTKLLEVLSFK